MFRLVRNARNGAFNQLFQFTHDFETVPITSILTFDVSNVVQEPLRTYYL